MALSNPLRAPTPTRAPPGGLRTGGAGRLVGPRALALLAVMALAGAGCSTVRGSAVATGPRQPGYSGPVAIYVANAVPAGAVDLGVVEVNASQAESTVGTLLPVFVQKVAQIGGNIAKIDGIRARFELVTFTHLETFYFPCGQRGQCAGQRMYTANDEIVVVSMRGHAYSDRASSAPAPTVPPPLPEPAPAQPPPAQPPPAQPSPAQPPPADGVAL